MQTKLLRVLQEMTFERVGASEPVKVDVRIVAATHQDLEELMRRGPVPRGPVLPAQRHHHPHAAAARAARGHRRAGPALPPRSTPAQRQGPDHIDDDALEALKAYDWPGNIRELENVIERAVVLAETSVITAKELPDDLLDDLHDGYPPPSADPDHSANGPPVEWSAGQEEWETTQDAIERDRLVRALAAANGNKAQAARALKLPRTTLLGKLEKYGLIPKRVKV